MLDALTVANTILQKGFDENIEITPMKLQKLIYVLYKEFIKTTGEALFYEKFEAWQFGPVLISVYNQFKKFGKKPIKGFFYDFELDGQKVYNTINLNTSGKFSEIFDLVWYKYKDYGAIELSSLTHRENTAWDKAVKNGTYILTDEDIKAEEDYE